MHDSDTGPLRRAVLLLVLVSAVRWGWSQRPAPPPAIADTLLPGLLAASKEEANRNDRRSEPLAEGERIDPNRADEVELDRLPGVGPSTARAIVAARDSGVIFRRPEDMLSVRGLGTVTVERLEPLLELRDPPPGRRRPASRATEGRVDLNTADVARLRSLPGIGPVIADRIVAERRERAFTSLEDLLRVRGVGPAMLERLRTLATVAPRP